MMTARSNHTYTPAESRMMSARSNHAYEPGQGPMMSARRSHGHPADDNSRRRHSSLQYDPRRSRWPFGEVFLPDLSHQLKARSQTPQEGFFNGWVALKMGTSASADSMAVLVRLLWLRTGEAYNHPEYGYARSIQIEGNCSGAATEESTFVVQYVSRGERANGDPVALIAVNPITHQFAVLEHLAKAACELPVERQLVQGSELLGVFKAFEELQRFFKVYRFDWSEQSGLRGYY